MAWTGGSDPIFRTNDGSNSPDADVSTLEARRAAYTMLLSKALIRIGKRALGTRFKLAIALAAVIGITTWQIVLVARSPYPRLRAFEAMLHAIQDAPLPACGRALQEFQLDQLGGLLVLRARVGPLAPWVHRVPRRSLVPSRL